MITLDEAKTHLRVGDLTSEQDAELMRLIDAAVLDIEYRTSSAIRSREERLVLDNFPSVIVLPWWPVQSVVTIYYTIDNVLMELPHDEYRLDTRQYPATITPAPLYAWPGMASYPEAVEITAQVGYATMPSNLKAAALLLVGHLWENREATTTAPGLTILPLSVGFLIQPYCIEKVG